MQGCEDWGPHPRMRLFSSSYNLMYLQIRPPLLCCNSQFTSRASAALALWLGRFHTERAWFRDWAGFIQSVCDFVVYFFIPLFFGSQNSSCLCSSLLSCDAMLIDLTGAFEHLSESVVAPLLVVLPTSHTPSFYPCRDENWRRAITCGVIGHHPSARHCAAPEILMWTSRQLCL